MQSFNMSYSITDSEVIIMSDLVEETLEKTLELIEQGFSAVNEEIKNIKNELVQIKNLVTALQSFKR